MKLLWAILALSLHSPVGNKTSGPVLIIGDSISVGYTRYVHEAMPCVSHSVKNSQWSGNSHWSGYALKAIPSYFSDGKKYTAIYFNAGIWDIAHRIPRSGIATLKLGDVNKYPVTTSPENYGTNLQAIVNELRTIQPQAKLIFATTTDVPPNSKGMRVEDVDIYNHIATQIMAKNNILVDDLNDWMKPYSNLHTLTKRNTVHYVDAGYRRLAQKVTTTLSQYVTCTNITASVDN